MNETLEAILKIVSIVLPIISTVIGGFVWVEKRITKGQTKLWKKYRKLSETHRQEITHLNNELALKVSQAQCDARRQECPCSAFLHQKLTTHTLSGGITPSEKKQTR